MEKHPFYRAFVLLTWLPLAFAGSLQHVEAADSEPTSRDGNTSFVFLSLQKRKAIAVYRQSVEDGSLSLAKEVAVESPGPLVSNAAKNLLYAVNYPQGVAAFRIDLETGDLRSLAQIQLPGRPEYLGLDQTGRFLMAALYSQNKIVVCPLDDQGRPVADRMQAIASGRLPHAIRSDRHNKYVYVPCKQSNKIYQYGWSEDRTGMLPKAIGKYATPDNVNPRHLWFHPQHDWLYVVNERGWNMTFYRIAAESGALTEVQTLTTFPSDAEKGSGAHIQITPNGRFVYSSNRGDNSIAGFAIDQESGKLTPLGQTPTANGPRAFAIDPGGRFLVSGGRSDGKIVVHAIDPQSGKLDTRYTYETAGRPVWVEIIFVAAGDS